MARLVKSGLHIRTDTEDALGHILLDNMYTYIRYCSVSNFTRVCTVVTMHTLSYRAYSLDRPVNTLTSHTTGYSQTHS